MPWVKLDEQFRHHPKIVQAGPVGIAMYVCGLSYAAEYLTDGFISRQAVRTLVDLDGVTFVGMNDNEIIDPIDVAVSLVDLGLWDLEPGGYRIHDYLDYNPSKVQVLADRATKQAAGRAGGVATATARAKAPADTGGAAKSQPVTVPVSVTDSDSPNSLPDAREALPNLDHDAIRGLEERTGHTWSQAGERQLSEYDRLVGDHGLVAVLGAFDAIANGKRLTARQLVWPAMKLLEPFIVPEVEDTAAQERDETRARRRDEATWARRIEWYENTGKWDEAWGAPPSKKETGVA